MYIFQSTRQRFALKPLNSRGYEFGRCWLFKLSQLLIVIVICPPGPKLPWHLVLHFGQHYTQILECKRTIRNDVGDVIL